MSTVRALAALPVIALLLAACGSDSSTSSTDAPTTTVAADVAATTSTLAAPASTTADTALSDDSSADEPLSGPVQIDVVVGVDSGPDRVEHVTVGSEITLNITNPDAPDEFHVHGVDLEQEADAGEMRTFNFTVTEPGTIEVESHLTEEVLVVIEVS
jgi:ABC-type glycerol-3-phosphate transport system substrate-binding protein